MLRIVNTNASSHRERDDRDGELERVAPPDPCKRPLTARIFREARTRPRSDAQLDRLLAAALRSSSRPLPVELVADLGIALRADVAAVRVHTGPEAAAAANALGAAAFALGVDVFFADGAFDPTSESGRRLIAHEVAHAVGERATSDALEISEPGDTAEHAADAAAQRYVERARGRFGDHPLDRLYALAGGAPLPNDLRRRFERSLGVDLGDVRVHVGGASGETARAVGTHAFAVGRDIHLADGAFDPDTREGQRVLAHEVAHAVQQGASTVDGPLDTTTPGDAVEVEADDAADAMLAGESAAVSAAPVRIARDDPKSFKKKAPPITTDMFTVEGGDPKTSDVTKAAPNGSDVTITASKIEANATIKLNDDSTCSGNGIIIGSTQTLMGSSRIGIYRKNGATDGEVVGQMRSTNPQGRDAMTDPNDPSGKTAKYPEPWYGPQQNINDTQRDGKVVWWDQPQDQIPQTMSGGRLTEIQGEENFITSWSAKQNDTLVHLKNFSWKVPWAMTISGNRGDGKGITSAPSAQGAPTTSGPTPMNTVKEWFHFDSNAAAMAADNTTLLRALDASRTTDADNMRICADALKAKNPNITIQIQVTKTDSTIGSDRVEVHLTGAAAAVQGPVAINDGQSGTFSFRLLDVFPDPTAITSGSALKVTAQDTGHLFNSNPHNKTWPFPYESTSAWADMSPGNNYKVQGQRG